MQDVCNFVHQTITLMLNIRLNGKIIHLKQMFSAERLYKESSLPSKTTYTFLPINIVNVLLAKTKNYTNATGEQALH